MKISDYTYNIIEAFKKYLNKNASYSDIYDTIKNQLNYIDTCNFNALYLNNIISEYIKESPNRSTYNSMFSQIFIERFAGDLLERTERDNFDVIQAEHGDDIKNHIDFYIVHPDGRKNNCQLKTVQIDSNNYTIPCDDFDNGNADTYFFFENPIKPLDMNFTELRLNIDHNSLWGITKSNLKFIQETCPRFFRKNDNYYLVDKDIVKEYSHIYVIGEKTETLQ